MQFNQQNLKNSNVRWDRLKNEAKNLIKNTTVMLKKNTGVGSGAIVIYKEQAAILTAAHNVLLATNGVSSDPYPQEAGTSTEKQKKYGTQYCSGLNVYFDPIEIGEKPRQHYTLQTQDVSNVLWFEKENVYSTDMVLIVLKTNQNTLSNWILEKPIGDFQNYADISTTEEQPTANSFIIRTGYGQNLDEKGTPITGGGTANEEGHLHVLCIENELFDFKAETVKLNNTQNYNNVVTYKSSDQNSTSSGDSGGPVFTYLGVIPNNKLCLVGVSIGANMFPDKLEEPTDKITNNAFTSVQAAKICQITPIQLILN